MSWLFYHVRARCQKKDNLQKLTDVGVFFLFHRRCFKKQPLEGNDFRCPMDYPNDTQNASKFHQDSGTGTGCKVLVEMGLDLLMVDWWTGLDWTLSWNMLVPGIPTPRFIDPSPCGLPNECLTKQIQAPAPLY